MARTDASLVTYWIDVTVVIGLYIWVIDTMDLAFCILLVILVILGIGYRVT